MLQHFNEKNRDILININGALRPRREAGISPFDSAVQGGDAVWDIGLAHPDLWAGVIPIVGTAGKYVARYWENGRHVPMYFVGGEMDGDRMALNARDLDRYLTTGEAGAEIGKIIEGKIAESAHKRKMPPIPPF